MNPIQNNELGSSVRTKLNKIITQVMETMVVKTADETRSSGTLSEDYDMLVVVEAGQSYVLNFSLIFYEASAPTDDIMIGWSLPALDGTGHWVLRHTASGAATTPIVEYRTDLSQNNFFIGNAGYYLMDGWIRFTPSAGGNVILKWCNHGGTGNSLMKAGSWIQLIPSTFAES